MGKKQVELRDVQNGGYIMIDEEPCEVNDYSTSKPGKHGSAKARVNAEGVFDGKKRSLTQPVDAKVWVPIIERKQGQIVSTDDNDAQVMDLETYKTKTFRIPDGESVSPDDEIEYLEWEKERKIVDFGN